MRRNIVTWNNIVMHFSFDNFDLLNATLSGLGTTHNTYDLIKLEIVSLEGLGKLTSLPVNLPRTMARSVSHGKVLHQK